MLIVDHKKYTVQVHMSMFMFYELSYSILISGSDIIVFMLHNHHSFEHQKLILMRTLMQNVKLATQIQSVVDYLASMKLKFCSLMLHSDRISHDRHSPLACVV